MIKILKHEKRFTLECPKCGCEFSYEPEDVRFDYQEDSHYVECPECYDRVYSEDNYGN